MQFVETSAIGVRSARYRFSSADGEVQVTVYPMVHVGEEAFYDEVYADAERHDIVLVEGVSGNPVKGLTRSYRWSGAKRLGLVVQPRFKSDKTRIVNADLDGGKFNAFYSRVPLRQRLLMSIGAPLFGLYMRFAATRRMLGKHLERSDLRDATDIASDDIKSDPLGYAINKARDDHIRAFLRMRIEDMRRAGGGKIAVIFGAGHARAIVRELQSQKMHVGDSSWHMLIAY